MKKFTLRSNLELDHFLDGEDVIYDSENEVTYVLNCSASIAMRIRLENDDASYVPIKEYKSAVLESLVDVDESELPCDFDDAVNMLLEKGIIEICDE